MSDLFPLFRDQLPNLSQQHICVGFSGGVDSIVLLHLLTRLRDTHEIGTLSAVHVHHGLSEHADDWLDFCRQTCTAWHIPFTAERVFVTPNNQGIEAAARTARYTVYAKQNSDIIALAHHRDDQLETFWLAALRGGGLRALSAMPTQRVLNKRTTLLRPLLPFSRAEIEAYAAQHQLDHVHDSSNDDPSLLRNWLRHCLLPTIAERIPQHDTQLLASIRTLQNERALLNEFIAQDWATLHAETERFSRRAWLTLSEARRQQMLYQFAHTHDLGTPRQASIADFSRVFAEARDSATWSLPRGTAVLYRQYLFAVPTDFVARNDISQLNLIWRDNPPAFPVRIRTARRDDVMRIAAGHKWVWEILQEAGVPPFARGIWAVAVDADDVCVAVANIRSESQLGMLWSDVLNHYRQRKPNDNSVVLQNDDA